MFQNGYIQRDSLAMRRRGDEALGSRSSPHRLGAELSNWLETCL